MEQGFIDILKQLAKEQGSAALTEAKKCKALLADYTKNEYKKESRMILQAVEAGVAKAITNADDLASCKKAKIRDLIDEYGFSQEVAAAIVDALALVLRGDTSKTEIEKPVAEKAARAEATVEKAVVETKEQVGNRETISKKATAEYTHKKASEYAKVVLDIAPLPCGGSYKIINAIFGGAIPRNYIPGVEAGVKEGLAHGILAGYPVVDIEITLVDGKYHPVDSSYNSFKEAALNAFREAMRQADPMLITGST